MTEKKESIEEFLARGGVIIKLPPSQALETSNVNVFSTTISGPATILTYSEANLMYGEIRQRKPRKNPKKPIVRIDMSVLPKAIRDKFLKGGEDVE